MPIGKSANNQHGIKIIIWIGIISLTGFTMKLYGAARCHKTQDYRMFFDVEKNGDYA